MLRLKTVPNLKKMLKRMIHPRFEKKKNLTRARSTLEKISLQEDMGRNENHGYRNPCPFQASPSKPKKKSMIQSWSTLLVGYPKWKVDVDSGKFPLAKMLRFRLSPVGLKRIH